ncbi:hypothetical protein [Sphingobium aquiterrae]|uniref:hypothetical protein n=1 Tax=Sphingobium aquiterrae TaxID=2038656 RepID=UPI0030162D70
MARDNAARALALSEDLFSSKLDARRPSIVYPAILGVVNSSTVDSSARLQAIVDAYTPALHPAGVTFFLPDEILLSQPITYYDNQEFEGRSKDGSVVWIRAAFTGVSAFVPRARVGDNDPVLRTKFSKIMFRDKAGASSGRGTTSTRNGIDVTGVFDCRIEKCKGYNINAIVYAGEGPAGKVQWTKRVIMSDMDHGNTNWLGKFDPATDMSRFPYGDIQLMNTETTGSCRYGMWAEDCDGFMTVGTVIFASGQLRLSGNALTAIGFHSFEARVALTENSNVTADGIIVCGRGFGGRNTGVNIAAGLAFQTARLADTTAGNPAQINKGGTAVRLIDVDGFNVQVTALDTSQQSFTATGCTTGVAIVTSLRANTQLLGSGALPVGTYDAVTLTDCTGVHVTLADTSTSKRHAVYMNDGCKGCSVNGTSSRGYGTPITFTAALVAATAGTLTANWSGATATYTLRFSDGSSRPGTLTNGSAAVTWTGGAVTATAAATAYQAAGFKSQVRVPTNGQNHYRIVSEAADGTWGVYNSEDAEEITISDNLAATAPAYYNGVHYVFNNTVSTNVTDITSIPANGRAFVRIQDNGASKLVDQSLATGGKFRFKAAATQLGRDYAVLLWREPNTGLLREI